MRKNYLEKVFATVLMAGMSVSMLAGCGGDTAEDVTYYRADYEENLPDTFHNLSGEPRVMGDVVYYASNNDDYTRYGIYSYNLETKEEKTYYVKEESAEYDPLAPGENVQCYSIDSKGNVYLYVNSWTIDSSNIPDRTGATFEDVTAWMVENWGYDENLAIQEWENYYTESYTEQGYVLEDGETIDYARVLTEWDSWNVPRTYTYDIKKLDSNGNELYKNTVSVENPNEESSVNKYVQSMEVGADDSLLLYVNEWDMNGMDKNYIEVYDATGKAKGTIELEGYGNDFVKLSDEQVGIMTWGDDGSYCVQILDTTAMKVGEEINFGTDYVESMKALDEENFLITVNGILYKYNLTTKEKEQYLSWVDANIVSSNVRSYELLEDGSILVATSTWDRTTYRETCEIAVVSELPAEEAAKIETINLACIFSDSELEQQVIDINKKNPETRIRIKQYYEDYGDMDYKDAMAGFITAMTSDPNNDIIYFNGGTSSYGDMMNFAAKGLLIDLAPLIEADEEIKREDLMESMLQACTYDEKLVGLPTTFSVQTVVGKVSDVGTEPGWTFADMKALLESKEPGTQLFYGKNRAWALEMCLNLGYKQFVDMENATCSFDNEAFIEILEFANTFPEEFEWEEGMDETILWNEGKVLLADYNISDFQQIQMYTEIFGEELTYIGYPTTEGNGALLSLSNCFTITKNCENTDAAWKLVREYFLPQEGEDLYYYSGMSIRNDDFDKYCEQAMKDDENGVSSWGWGNFEVEIQPTTQEQVDTVKDLMANLTAVQGSMSTSMMNIINEEAAAYFSGQKSAEEVATIIQSRMQVYLSETN